MIRECGIRTGCACSISARFWRRVDAACRRGRPGRKVVAVDREQRAVDVARNRVEDEGYRQIESVLATEEALPEDDPFDAAVGRYVLVHQPDPAAMVRRAAGSVRSGAIVAFHESFMGSRISFFRWLRFAKPFSPTPRDRPHLGVRLSPEAAFGLFRSSGTPDCRRVSPFASWWSATTPRRRSLCMGSECEGWLRCLQLKIGSPDLGDLDTLSERLRAKWPRSTHKYFAATVLRLGDTPLKPYARRCQRNGGLRNWWPDDMLSLGMTIYAARAPPLRQRQPSVCVCKYLPGDDMALLIELVVDLGVN